MDIPNSLFKYSKIKPYSIETIEMGYVYFCPANKLDDQFECLVNWSKYKYLYDDKKNDIAIEVTLEVLKKFGINICNTEIKEFYNDCDPNNIKALKYFLYNSNISKNKANKILRGFEEIQNFKLNSDEEENLKKVIRLQDYVGIFSLAEENNNQVLWSMYANNYNGYCIEYDIESFLSKNPQYKHAIFKVKYEEERKADPIKELLRIIFRGLFGNLGIKINNSQNEDFMQVIIDIATTKHIDWRFQKEWRIIGEPCNKNLKIPIKSIYLGKNLSKTNKSKILRICKKNKIRVFTQIDDLETLKIKFE